MISVDAALAQIFEQIRAPAAEIISLADAHRRVLAEPLTGRHNQPPFDSSAMDGYAVRAEEVTPDQPLKLAGTSQAGARFTGMMERGQCVRIFTGAPMPIGADAVVIQEQSRAAGNHIAFEALAVPGQNVRRQGMDFTRGQVLLEAGVDLTPAMLNLAAAANYPTLSVTKRPKLALIATGDELVAPGTSLGRDQIVASNSYGLIPLLGPYTDQVLDLGIVPDEKAKIERALIGAFDAGVEVLVTTGGASVGDRDYVREVLIDLGVKLDFWKLNMRPGKPLMFGTRGSTLVFGLPGNPVSAMVTATVILRPALRKMTGHADPFWPQMGVPLAGDLPANGDRRHFRRGLLRLSDIGFLEVLPIAETDSAHSSSLAAANALIVQPENDPGRQAGDIVEIIPLGWG